jgi:hypothetical protein
MGLGVQGSQRFIQQQQARLGREGAGQRYPLCLPSGDGWRLRLCEVGDADASQQEGGASPGFPLIQSADEWPECDIVEHPEVWKQQVVLKHHTNRALVRGPMNTGGRICHYLATDRDLAGRDPEEPSQCPERSGLTGAVRAKQRDYFSGTDL